MPDPTMAVHMTGNDQDLARMIARQQKTIDGLKNSYRELGKQGKETGDSLHIGSGVVGEIAGLAAGYLSVSTVLGRLAAAGETWKSILKETTQASREAVEQSKPFASLQTGDKGIRAPVMAALKAAVELGVKDQGAVLGLAGGLQSAMGGDLEGAQRELRELLVVHRATGVPLEEIGDPAKLAAIKGMDPGQFVREIVAAARERKLGASTIMHGARSMGAFATPEQWIAAQGALATQLGHHGPTAVGELPALFGEGAPKDFAAFLKKQGIRKEIPMMDALGRLHAGGFTTIESLKKSGLDIKQRELIAMAAEAQPGIVDLARRLPAMGTEEVIDRRRAAMIAELPEMEQAERAARLEVSARQELAFGPRARAAAEADEELLVRGLALRRMGMESYAGARLVDESGRMTGGGPWGFLTAAFWARTVAGLQGPSELIPPAKGEYTRAEEWHDMMRIVREELQKGTEPLGDAASKLRGGAALVPAGEDR